MADCSEAVAKLTKESRKPTEDADENFDDFRQDPSFGLAPERKS